MNTLVVAPLRNKGLRPDGRPKKDADEFRARAADFVRLRGLDAPAVIVDNGHPSTRRARQLLRFLADAKRPLACFAYFGHGLKTGLPSVGLDQRLGNVAAFAHALVGTGAALDLRVVLYACDAARNNDRDKTDDLRKGPGGDGGFADELRDRLVDLGLPHVAVFAHAVTGHTTRAPWVRVFRGEHRGRGHGDWLVEPHSPLWASWVRALARPDGTLWARFPWMGASELEAELLLEQRGRAA